MGLLERMGLRRPKPKWNGPMKGLRFRDLRVSAPGDEATADQLLDYGILLAIHDGFFIMRRYATEDAERSHDEWVDRVVSAYLAKWEGKT